MLPSLIKVEQRQADAFVIAGDLHDQAQVGLDHVLARLFVALLDPGGEFDFLLRREQFHLADFAEVKLDGGVAVVGGALGPVIRRFRFRRGIRFSGFNRLEFLLLFGEILRTWLLVLGWRGLLRDGRAGGGQHWARVGLWFGPHGTVGERRFLARRALMAFGVCYHISRQK